MNKILAMYKSKYGATKKYAEWLSKELSCDVIETKKAKVEDVLAYETIILGGGIYASGIAGISFLKNNFEKLKGKKIIVFAVGASPYNEKAMHDLKERNFKDELAGIPCFYCRGAWNEEKMSLVDRTLCKMLKKAVAKKKPSEHEPWETALMEAIGNNHDWTDKKELKLLLEYIRQ
jgi:menaquinone-dependent protoporphyrinogen IX oxidase